MRFLVGDRLEDCGPRLRLQAAGAKREMAEVQVEALAACNQEKVGSAGADLVSANLTEVQERMELANEFSVLPIPEGAHYKATAPSHIAAVASMRLSRTHRRTLQVPRTVDHGLTSVEGPQ